MVGLPFKSGEGGVGTFRTFRTDDHMTCAAADVSVESEIIGSLVSGRIQRHDAIILKNATEANPLACRSRSLALPQIDFGQTPALYQI